MAFHVPPRATVATVEAFRDYWRSELDALAQRMMDSADSLYGATPGYQPADQAYDPRCALLDVFDDHVGSECAVLVKKLGSDEPRRNGWQDEHRLTAVELGVGGVR